MVATDGAWTPPMSGNRLAREGEVVVKRYGARLEAFARESTLLARLAALPERLPVPRPLPPLRFGELRYAYVAGVSGMEAIAGGLAPQVLGGMGAFLRRLHALASDSFGDVVPGSGPVLAHGDFAPYNVLVDGRTGTLLAVLDWEEARRDAPVLDLAWCEAQLLRSFPRFRWALRHLHEGYGAAPGQAELQGALERRMAELSARARADASPALAAEDGALHRCVFTDAGEAAAFVAALARALAGPAGASCGTLGAAPLVWAAGDGRTVFLAEPALRAATGCFGDPGAARVPLSDVPASSRLLYGTGTMPAWGMETALGRLTSQ